MTSTAYGCRWRRSITQLCVSCIRAMHSSCACYRSPDYIYPNHTLYFQLDAAHLESWEAKTLEHGVRCSSVVTTLKDLDS
jgi:hypothetical protein